MPGRREGALVFGRIKRAVDFYCGNTFSLKKLRLKTILFGTMNIKGFLTSTGEIAIVHFLPAVLRHNTNGGLPHAIFKVIGQPGLWVAGALTGKLLGKRK